MKNKQANGDVVKSPKSKHERILSATNSTRINSVLWLSRLIKIDKRRVETMALRHSFQAFSMIRGKRRSIHSRTSKCGYRELNASAYIALD
jgi:predicted 2-oxoglutarate/Fe(II)-dependent dioxygenase YbiX